jgi:hypothetical protein
VCRPKYGSREDSMLIRAGQRPPELAAAVGAPANPVPLAGANASIDGAVAISVGQGVPAQEHNTIEIDGVRS